MVYLSQVKRKQLRGLSSGLTSDITTRSESMETLKIVLNKEKINRIFLEYPQVEKIYHESVPHKMSESEFWTLYFHSKYAHRQEAESAKNPASSEESKSEVQAEKIFGTVDRDEEIEAQSQRLNPGK